MVAVKSQLLNIYMNGIQIGKLKKSKNGALDFSYVQAWLDRPSARAISLSLPLSARAYTGDIVYNYFDNLLPDNPQIRKKIQSKFHILSNHPFDLLAKIGNDCIGAIQVVNEEDYHFQKSIDYKPLKKEDIAKILRNYQHNPLGMTNELDAFRISIAGAQEKTALLYHKKKWNLPLGTTPTSHILKLPIGLIEHQQLDLSDSCENEWLCSKIAKAYGFKVANCEIQHFKDMKALVVERFDRKLSSDKSWLLRLPQEDMCQALGVSSTLKHQSDGGPGIKEILKLLLGSNNSTEDRNTFFRSQILLWLLCAIDGHAKNYSISIEPEGKYRLTPLYDIMSAFPLIKCKQLQEKKIKMAMALRGKNIHYKWYNIKRSHFISTAKNVRYSSKMAEQLLDEMLELTDEVINNVSKTLPKTFPNKISTPIFEGMLIMKERLKKK